MLNQIKRQYHNIFKINAASFWPMAKNAAFFPCRWKFNWDSRPVNIVWDITYRCNLDCQYCLFAKSKLHSIEKELPIKEIIPFIDGVAKYQPSFFITGGEPLLRADLEQIISAIRKKRMKVGMNTNATLLTKDRILKLNAAGLNYLIISMDLDELATDQARGAGIYQKALAAINLISELKVKTKVVVNSVLTEKNFAYLDRFLDFIDGQPIAALKISYIYFNTAPEAALHKRECLARLGFDLEPDFFQKELPGSGKEIAEKIQSVLPKVKKMKVPVSFNPNLSKEEIINWFNDSKPLNRKCLYVFNVVRLSPAGDIYPCHFINKPVGNIVKDDFLKKYNGFDYKKLRQELKKSFFPGCRRCNKL